MRNQRGTLGNVFDNPFASVLHSLKRVNNSCLFVIWKTFSLKFDSSVFAETTTGKPVTGSEEQRRDTVFNYHSSFSVFRNEDVRKLANYERKDQDVHFSRNL